MSQGTVYQTRQQHGWDTTSDDYHTCISRLSRMSSVLHGAPQYPSVHKAFNNKVQVTEQVQIIEQNGNQKSEVIEETVDDEAGGFELCKWKTFKLP
ncbi:hypothetical protein NC651_033974 [Populus alba x Populus x berolinensis]|nr:hypothetical protein NC651_033974 [Populus alba x Populus x berolinensis]